MALVWRASLPFAVMAFLPSVRSFSATGRNALALARVVLMRRCSMSDLQRFFSSASRWSFRRWSLTVFFLCLISKSWFYSVGVAECLLVVISKVRADEAGEAVG